MPAIAGFLAYHVRTGRTRFVDQIYVDPQHRRQGAASALLAQIATGGPVELIARRDNAAAISLYVQLGFCVQHKEPLPYPPHDHEVYMRTSNHKRAAQLATERGGDRWDHLRRWHAWSSVPAATRRYMCEAVWSSLPEAERRRRATTAKVRLLPSVDKVAAALRRRRRLSDADKLALAARVLTDAEQRDLGSRARAKAVDDLASEVLHADDRVRYLVLLSPR